MADDKADPNQIKYKGELVNEAGVVIMTCETAEVAPKNVMSLFDDEYPFATSPFDEEPRPPEMPRDKTVLHKTMGGKGVVGRIK